MNRKTFPKKKKGPIVTNLAAIKCSSPFNHNVIDEENDQKPKGGQKFQPCFQSTLEMIKITPIRNSKMNEKKVR